MTETTAAGRRGRPPARTHTRLNYPGLVAAVKVAMAQHTRPDGRPFTGADVAREAGVDEPAMSGLLKNGGPLDREELFLILAWLNVSPAMWRLDAPVPAPRKAA